MLMLALAGSLHSHYFRSGREHLSLIMAWPCFSALVPQPAVKQKQPTFNFSNSCMQQVNVKSSVTDSEENQGFHSLLVPQPAPHSNKNQNRDKECPFMQLFSYSQFSSKHESNTQWKSYAVVSSEIGHSWSPLFALA